MSVSRCLSPRSLEAMLTVANPGQSRGRKLYLFPQRRWLGRVPLQSESHIHNITRPSCIPSPPSSLPKSPQRPDAIFILTTTCSVPPSPSTSPPSSPRTDLNLVPLQLFYGTGRRFVPPPSHRSTIWCYTFLQC